MTLDSTPSSDGALALAVVSSSTSPLLMLADDLTVLAASASFCHAFRIDGLNVHGRPIHAIGAGEWNLPQLRSLLRAVAETGSPIESYEMDLETPDRGPRLLVLNVQRLDYQEDADIRLLLAIADVTDVRIAERVKDDMIREKAVLIQEVQHRIANSLQIIASLIMQSARRVQSDELRGHLHNAHDRVLSIATVQQHLARSDQGTVALHRYLTQLCQSLGDSMIGDPDQLSIEVRVDQSVVDGDVSVSLGLIVTELVINALKHAFPGNRKGKITVEYNSSGLGWTLAVSDDGAGMPMDPQLATAGLGTSIVEALARQLAARITIGNAQPGTKILVSHLKVVRSAAFGGDVVSMRRAL